MLDPVMVDVQAGQCGRCRGELGVAGRVCQHCRLDEQFVGWEVRIYSLQTHAMAAGQAVTAEEAIIRVSPHFLPYQLYQLHLVKSAVNWVPA